MVQKVAKTNAARLYSAAQYIYISKHVIFSTDCSQLMGLQSVPKIRGKVSKLFALRASPPNE
jgi:hypothetical protein